MDRLVIRTNKEHKGGDDSKHSFKKEVKVDSLAVYWQPQEKNIYRLGKPPFQKSAVFFNIVQKAFDPPPLLFEHLSYFAGGVF